MSAVAAPADRRFRRAHVKPARTRRRWAAHVRRVVLCTPIALAAAYVVYEGSLDVALAHVLKVDRILVHGNDRLPQSEVLAILAGLRGESLVRTDLDRWRQRLLASPWVRDAALRRSLPSTVEVLVWERQPMGIGRLHDDMYLVDDRGAVIDHYGPRYAALDLPIVDGLAAPGSKAGTTTDASRGELASRVVSALKANPDVRRRLSQIDVSDLHNAQVILSGDPAVIALGDDQFLARLESYLELADALHARVAEIDYVDVRYDNRIYVRPAPAASKKKKR